MNDVLGNAPREWRAPQEWGAPREWRGPEDRRYEVIVIGSGAGGSMAAMRLVQAGLEVLLIERGLPLPKDGSTLDIARVVQRGEFKSREAWITRRRATLVPEEWFNLGGKTKWYGAALARFGAEEFGADAEHAFLPFPFGVAELAPYYERVERLLGVRTLAAEDDLERVLAALAARAPEWRASPLPMGLSPEITLHPHEARHFDGFASPRGLKADGEATLLSRVSGAPNLHVSCGRAVVALEADPARPTRIVGVRLEDGSIYRAGHVVLAAGALHSPRLLQRHVHAHGLHDLPIARNIGRNLKLHLLTAVLALSPSVKRDLVRKTTLLTTSRAPHSSVQPLGFDGELLASLFPALVPRRIARTLGQRAYGFFLQTEDGSHRDNRVIAAGTEGAGDAPIFDYEALRSPRSEREHRQFVKSFRRDLFRAGYVNFAQRIGLAGTAHACGTLVTGTDPVSSVVDAEGRVHGFEGLYVADGSVLPRLSRVNPALTIYAWSLRAAERLVQRYERTGLTAVPA